MKQQQINIIRLFWFFLFFLHIFKIIFVRRVTWSSSLTPKIRRTPRRLWPPATWKTEKSNCWDLWLTKILQNHYPKYLKQTCFCVYTICKNIIVFLQKLYFPFFLQIKTFSFILPALCRPDAKPAECLMKFSQFFFVCKFWVFCLWRSWNKNHQEVAKATNATGDFKNLIEVDRIMIWENHISSRKIIFASQQIPLWGTLQLKAMKSKPRSTLVWVCWTTPDTFLHHPEEVLIKQKD